MTQFRRELVLVGTKSELPRISRFVEEACDGANVDSAARFDLQMAVDEACCNVFEHAYGGSAGEIDLRFETRGRDVVITLHDQGRAFNPEGIPPPDTSRPLEERPVGGLGLHLMRKLMDKVFFAFSLERGNTLVMEKHKVVPGDPKKGSSEGQSAQPSR
jgi:anti-sigma regulatory factor (Ser/Thr protein kinase)